MFLYGNIQDMMILLRAIHWFFLLYSGLLVVRVVSSWVPRLAGHPAMRLVHMYTEPYLGLFRRLIPPIGGALDLSPMIGFFALNFLEQVVMWFLKGFFK